jgi:hypothetical protein
MQPGSTLDIGTIRRGSRTDYRRIGSESRPTLSAKRESQNEQAEDRTIPEEGRGIGDQQEEPVSISEDITRGYLVLSRQSRGELTLGYFSAKKFRCRS